MGRVKKKTKKTGRVNYFKGGCQGRKLGPFQCDDHHQVIVSERVIYNVWVNEVWLAGFTHLSLLTKRQTPHTVPCRNFFSI